MKQNETNIPSEKLAAFVDNELMGAERAEIEKRLDQDSELREGFNAQKQVKNLVHDCVVLERAPVHLRSRIRRSLEDAQKTPGFFNLLADIFRFHAAKSLLAAAVLLLLVTFPWLQNMGSDTDLFNGGKYQIVEGKVICV